MTRLGGVVLTLGAVAAAICGCSLITSYDGFTGVVPKRPPPKGTAAGGDGPTRGAAVASWRFQDQSDLPELGYDVDEQCTCPNAPGSCVNDRGGTVLCDNQRGNCVDNQVASTYITQLGKSFDFGASAASSLDTVGNEVADDLRTGRHGIFVELVGWDGQPDDGEIQLALMNVTDVNEEGEYQEGALNEYAVDPDSLPLGGDPELFPGYVAQNTVVVRGIDFDLTMLVHIPLDGGDTGTLAVHANIRNGLFVGQIKAKNETTFAMDDAQLTGAIPIELLQRQLFDFDRCPGEMSSGVEPFQEACRVLDLSYDDPRNLNAPCNGMSFAIGMNLRGAKRVAEKPAELHPFPPKRRRCPAEPPGCSP